LRDVPVSFTLRAKASPCIEGLLHRISAGR
jgi:hypothetical protein